MKKIYIVFLVFSFMMLCSSIYAKTGISVSSANAKVGDKVDVKVNIIDNTGIVGAEIKVNYDNTKIEYIDGKQGDVLNGKMAVINDNGTNVKLVCVGENINKNGILMTLTFKVKENVLDEKIPLNLEVEKLINDLGNEKIVDVENTTENGYITITKELSSDKKEDSNKTEKNVKEDNNDEKIAITKSKDGKYKIENNTDSKKVTYMSSDENVASIDKDGSITVKGKGQAKIIAVFEDGTNEEISVSIPENESDIIIEKADKKDNSTNLEEVDIYDSTTEIAQTNKMSKKYLFIAIGVVFIFLVILIVFKRKKK